MPKDIHQRRTPPSSAASRLLLAMGVIVLLGALAYFVLTLAGQPPHPGQPRHPPTPRRMASTVSYESAVWPVCEMTEDATLGHALELASAADSV